MTYVPPDTKFKTHYFDVGFFGESLVLVLSIAACTWAVPHIDSLDGSYFLPEHVDAGIGAALGVVLAALIIVANQTGRSNPDVAWNDGDSK